jgi:hypothetical protein
MKNKIRSNYKDKSQNSIKLQGRKQKSAQITRTNNTVIGELFSPSEIYKPHKFFKPKKYFLPKTNLQNVSFNTNKIINHFQYPTNSNENFTFV